MKLFLLFFLSFCLFISLGSTTQPSLTDAKDKSLSIMSNPYPNEIAKRAQKKAIPWWNRFVSRKTLTEFESVMQPYPITSGASLPILMIRRFVKMTVSLRIKILLAELLSLSTVFDSYTCAYVSVLFDLLDLIIFYKSERNVLFSGLFPFICMLYLHAEVSVVHALCWQTSCMESEKPLTLYITIIECIFAWIVHGLLHNHLHRNNS